MPRPRLRLIRVRRGREAGAWLTWSLQSREVARAFQSGNVRLQEVSQTSGSLTLRRTVEALALHARINASRARRDFAVTLGPSVMSLYISEIESTESLRFLHLAQASTRRLTLVRGCIAGNWRRVSTEWQRAPHGDGRVEWPRVSDNADTDGVTSGCMCVSEPAASVDDNGARDMQALPRSDWQPRIDRPITSIQRVAPRRHHHSFCNAPSRARHGIASKCRLPCYLTRLFSVLRRVLPDPTARWLPHPTASLPRSTWMFLYR
jgi:hypothetical protein